MKLSSYRKTMAQALAEAQMVSDISGISITALKKEARKFNQFILYVNLSDSSEDPLGT